MRRKLVAEPLLVVHVLVFFVFLMAMAPVPILALLLFLEVFVIDVCPVTRLQPAPVNVVLGPIPGVVVLVIRIVDASLSFLLLMPLMLILRASHSKGA